MSIILSLFRGLLRRIFPTSNESSWLEPLNISDPLQEETQDPIHRPLNMDDTFSETNRLSKIEKIENMNEQLGRVKKLKLYFEEKIRQINSGVYGFKNLSSASYKSIPPTQPIDVTISKPEKYSTIESDISEDSSGEYTKDDNDIKANLIEFEDEIDKISANCMTITEPSIQETLESESKIIPERDLEIETNQKLQLKKLPKIVEELIENEKKYVETLHEGIKNYVTIFNDSPEMIPRELNGLKYHLFNNIENIYEFHNEILLPSLRDVGNDLVKIAETFTTNIKNNYFYCYVLYAINKKHSDDLCRKHNIFFNELKVKCNDMLGVSSFTLQPIQRVPRYQLLMNEIAKELTKDIITYKNEISKVCVAEKSIQRLLNSVNEALSIHDITICKEVDIFCQGQFKKMSEFQITDARQKRKYKGKVFFFQQKIIYAESKDGKLEYCGYFDCDDVAIGYSTKITKFKLCYNHSSNASINLHSDPATIVEWLSLLEQVLSDNIKKISRDNCTEVFSYSDLNIPASLAESKVRPIEEPEMEMVKGILENRTVFYT